ncbi:unnamed protein product, partial [Didymodactylos carnosus]
NLKAASLNPTGKIWLGANNFASFLDSQWRWLDGSVFDSTIINWCAGSTSTSPGAQCMAYNSATQCVTNDNCSSLYTYPCAVAAKSTDNTDWVSYNLQTWQNYFLANGFSVGCGTVSSYWFTYTLLLLNWLILLSLILYVCYRFLIDKRRLIISCVLITISAILIIAFAILWGLQCQYINDCFSLLSCSVMK